MKVPKSKILAIFAMAVVGILAVALIAVLVANRPIVTAPRGTAPLDNKLDTDGVARLVVDEAEVLAEETEQIIAIYNANWNALAGRALAVVTVETTESAEDDAWKWADRLGLGKNDALLLMETGVGKDCVLVANGTFREDITTLGELFLPQLTYMGMKYDDFDFAALAVFERLHYLYGYDQASHRHADRMEAYLVLSAVGLLMLPILIHMIAEKVDGRRFKRWYNDYGHTDPPTAPWKTVFYWHRTGSRWYAVRVSGEWVDYRSVLRNHRNDREAKVASGRYR